MASKGYTEDLIPKRDKAAGREAIREQRAREGSGGRPHETFEVKQRDNPGHPDGYKNNR